MFILYPNLDLSFVSASFVDTYSLPTAQRLQGISVFSMLEYIVSPESDEDHNVLSDAKTKLQAINIAEDVLYKLPINGTVYELALSMLPNGKILGKMAILELAHLAVDTEKPQQDLLDEPQPAPLLEAVTPKQDVTAKLSHFSAKQNSNHIKNLFSIYSGTQKQTLPRILVVDDSEVNREVVSIFLSPDFPQPLYAKNGQEALDILANNPVDLILMDIHMPEMNGVEATLAIRESKAPWSEVIIIALTADTEYQHKRVYRNIGMNDAIGKPLRQDVLTRTILINWNAAKLSKETQSTQLDYAS